MINTTEHPWSASRDGHHQIVEMLLAAGAECCDEWWRSVHLDCILWTSSNVNVADHYGRTPMYIAAENGYHRVVEMLLVAGADKNATCSDGRTPIMITFSAFQQQATAHY